MTCPVCQSLINSTELMCPECGFKDIGVTFVNPEDANEWLNTVVKPCRERYKYKLQAERLKHVEDLPGRKTSCETIEFEYIEDEDGVVITKYKGTSCDVLVPDRIDYTKVYAIAGRAFEGLFHVRNVILPSTITYIGDASFAGCLFNKIIIPDSCRHIGKSAFAYSNIEEICFPENIENISENVCGGCMNLKKVVIKNASVIEKNAFNRCKYLETIILSESLHTIDRWAFMATNLHCVSLPASVKSIHEEAFRSHITETTRHILFPEDSVEFVLSKKPKTIYFRNTIFYCNQGSNAYKYAKSMDIPIKSIAEYPKDI